MVTKDQLIAVASWARENSENLEGLTSAQINGPEGMSLDCAFSIIVSVLMDNLIETKLSVAGCSDVDYQIELAKKSTNSVPSWIYDGPRQDGSEIK